MYVKSPVTERVKRIRAKVRSTKPKIDISRYKLITEFYQENPQLTGILKRAKNLRNLFEKINKGYDQDKYRELNNIMAVDISDDEGGY